ncbi:MAG: hypothetical protein LBH32_08835, partial [Dysgonamonadaceae bacterium]|nr:hypothetical protein [Dysgonamonadaceae bacterium]
NTHIDEIINQSYANTFVNGDSYDYHLQPTSAGKNAGTDGTDVGIYGTAFPFKESKLPSIPHFTVKNISTETNAEGKLPVYIKIEAQDN